MTYSQVPLGVQGFERINEAPVNVGLGRVIRIGQGAPRGSREDNFALTGTVCALTQKVRKTQTQDTYAVVGSEAYVSLWNFKRNQPAGPLPMIFRQNQCNKPLGHYPGGGNPREWVRYDPMNLNSNLEPISVVQSPYSYTTIADVNFRAAHEQNHYF